MGNQKELAGKCFGRLTALLPKGQDKHGNYLWKCSCQCGNDVLVSAHRLLCGNTKSCGCYKIEKHLAFNKSKKGKTVVVKKIINVDKEKIFKLIREGKSAWQIEKYSTISSPTIKKYVKKWNIFLYQIMRENGKRNKVWAGYIDGRAITRKFKTDKCFDCGTINKRLEIHHLKPAIYSKNWQIQKGDHRPENLITLCNSCHQKRHYTLGTRVHKVKHNKLNGRFIKNEN